MAASNYRWVCTDRRTDAEILKEIAEADTPVVILSREEPDVRMHNFCCNYAERTDVFDISLAEVPGEYQLWKYINRLPIELCLLIESPTLSSFILIVTEKIRHRATVVGTAGSLWDWIIRQHVAGGSVMPVSLELQPLSYRPIHDPVRHQLAPANSSELSPTFRANINQFAGLKLPANSPDVIALRAGLFQWHDALEESHECSQSIEGQGTHRAGDYWHAIMHRREPDYGNSKYWFRRVGRHPIFDELGRQAAPRIAAAAPAWESRLLNNGWDPFAFVDLCETVADGRPAEWVMLAETIQELEMLLLLASTYHDAVKGV